MEKTATYGQIALLCGKPENARQVGYALNRGRLGEGIPAHRVVNARGILSGAAAFETADMQKRLLEKEGVMVHFTPDGWQVDRKRMGGTIQWTKQCGFNRYSGPWGYRRQRAS